jgi:hypothetical protein
MAAYVLVVSLSNQDIVDSLLREQTSNGVYGAWYSAGNKCADHSAEPSAVTLPLVFPNTIDKGW